jgi:glycosyltransferase involved in cell wall biosynthesis
MTAKVHRTQGFDPLAVPVDHVFEMTGGIRTGETITVAVALYNYEEFIGACLKSILSQTWADLDLVVVDDASPNENALVVARDWMMAHAQRFRRALLLRHCRNQGLAMTRNTAFRHALGDFVFVIDCDNMLYPRATTRLRQVLQDGDFSAAYSQLEFFGSETRLGHADFWLPERFKPGNYVDAMALISRSAWARVGGYSHMSGFEDYDFWCKFVEHGLSAAYVPEILCRYRVHEKSMLRTETAAAYDALFVQMSMRHPWLRFEA